MIRVLHVHGRDADFQTSESVHALRAAVNGGVEQTTRTIGRGGDYTNLPWAVLGLRRLVDRVDVLHAWDERSYAAASLARARRIVFTLPPHVTRGNGNGRGRNIAYVCTTQAQHESCVARGMPAEQCHLIRPPLRETSRDESNRAAARGSLGIRDDNFVMLAPGESTRQAAHERAVWAGSILHVTDERFRVLLWGRGPRLDIASGLGDKLRQDGLVVVAERSLGRSLRFADLLPAADAMLVTATAPVPTLPLAMGMATGVPVVAADRAELAELLTDGLTALTVPTCTPRLLAQRLLDLRAHPGVAREISVAARTCAQEFFRASVFAAEYHRLYGLAASGPRLTLPESAVALGPGT